MHVEWDVAGRCEAPLTRICYARPYPQKNGRDVIVIPFKTPNSLLVELEVRCRKCRNCLWQRQKLWSARAITEYRSSHRTWLGTLTLSPDEHDRVLNLCRLDEVAHNQDFDLLSEQKQFALRHNRISKHLTKWLKRIRKDSGARLRYLLVAEAHKSGLPHYHALIHEPVIDEQVTKSVMQAQWPHGFTNFKLIPEHESSAASYACKYLSKSILARVRASIRYGLGEAQATPPQDK